MNVSQKRVDLEGRHQQIRSRGGQMGEQGPIVHDGGQGYFGAQRLVADDHAAGESDSIFLGSLYASMESPIYISVNY